MRRKVILNPWANRGKAIELKDTILKRFNDYGEVDVSLTEGQGHATRLASTAVDEGYDVVVAAGGDGTVHEVINGLVHGDRGQATLGIVPIGSGNDFAFGSGLLADPESAIRTVCTGKPRSVDLARMEDDRGRYTLVNNGIGIGFDATVTIQSRNITRIHGFPMYLLAVLQTIALYYQTPRLNILFDEAVVEQESLLLAIGIGPRVGGGFYLTPEGKNNNGLLDSCTVNPVGRLTMLWMLPKVMRGAHVKSKHVTMRKSGYIDIRSNLPLPIHVDGEIFAYPSDNVRRLTVSCIPSALEVLTASG
ncbi:MAG TPA: diacylglycerol kinase family protein [candidate division Zixibacteria bacterium]|nr:diacylglycerol kinase family protein [candidate division Zixibacteria bacterium]